MSKWWQNCFLRELTLYVLHMICSVKRLLFRKKPWRGVGNTLEEVRVQKQTWFTASARISGLCGLCRSLAFLRVVHTSLSVPFILFRASVFLRLSWRGLAHSPWPGGLRTGFPDYPMCLQLRENPSAAQREPKLPTKVPRAGGRWRPQERAWIWFFSAFSAVRE